LKLYPKQWKLSWLLLNSKSPLGNIFNMRHQNFSVTFSCEATRMFRNIFRRGGIMEQIQQTTQPTATSDPAALAARLVENLKHRNRRIVFAESCTAGLVSGAVAAIPGASAVLWGAFVTYSIAAKTTMLGIEPALIEQYGAVSRETACAMAQGALEKSKGERAPASLPSLPSPSSGYPPPSSAEATPLCSYADIAVAITGLAGPDGDGSDTPIGTVWTARAIAGQAPQARCHHFKGNRQQIREAAVLAALEFALTP
jgi:nicotinamide mononucleotide (NMN) deamidase PncC